MNLPNTIEQVIEQLDQIILSEKTKQSPLVYFAILYREVTLDVRKGIDNGRFEDGDRMERLDVAFASRYLTAYHQFQKGQSPTRSWAIAFEAASDSNLIVLQHLLLGINAHIDLDLGIAAAEIASGDQLPALKNDFQEINTILYALVPTVQERIASVSLLIGLFDRLGGLRDEQLAHFGLGLTRDHAWRMACLLAPLPQDLWEPIVHTTDEATALLANFIRQPRIWLAKGLIWLIGRFESKDVLRNVQALSNTPKAIA